MSSCGTRARPKPGSLRLSFAKCRLSLAKLLEALDGLPSERIEELDVSQNDLGDAAPQKLLARLPHLRVLRLNSCGLTAQGLRASLRVLAERWLESEEDLGFDPQSGATDATLPHSRKLQVLELAACSADAAVPELALYLANPCCTLTELDLSWNSLGPHAVQRLAWHLRHNVTLRSLGLAHCHLKQSAGVLLSSLSGSGMPLQRLNLARNDLPGSAFQELAAFLRSDPGRRLRDLDLSGNGATSEESCSRVLGQALEDGPGELNLALAGTKPFFDAAYGRWDAAPQLLTVLRSPASRVMKVNLDHCCFKDAAISSLARICLNVRSFSMCNCEAAVGSAGQSFMMHLEDLARGLRRRGEFGSQASRRPPMRLMLEELRLNELQLQDASVHLLAQALESLSAQGMDLRELELEGNHLTHEGVAALNLSALRKLNLSRNKLRPMGGLCLGELLASRSPEAPLLDLELRRCALNSEGVMGLWPQALSANARLRRLNLAENALEEGMVEAMLDLDIWAPALQELQLLPNPCGSGIVAKLLQRMAPWRSMVLHAPEMSQLPALMNCLGAPLRLAEAMESPAGRWEGRCQEFLISLSSLRVQPAPWQSFCEALSHATIPPMQLASSVRLPRSSSPFRRLGGCGAAVRLELDGDLSQGHFSHAREREAEGKKAKAKSLAVRARMGLEDASPKAAFRPKARAEVSVRPEASNGGADTPGARRRPPPPRICRQDFGKVLERYSHVELQVSSVLRELRNVEGLRLVRCGLTDRWIAQLGHSGNSSKWSAIRLLDLRHNALTSQSCPAIATVISGGLQALLLDGNQLEVQGLEVLCKAMRNCSLRWLSLAENRLGHPAGTMLADVFLAGPSSLQELSLAMNAISSSEIAVLLRALLKLTIEDLYLDLAHTRAEPQVLALAMRALGRCPGLVLNLSGCRALSAVTLQVDGRRLLL